MRGGQDHVRLDQRASAHAAASDAYQTDAFPASRFVGRHQFGQARFAILVLRGKTGGGRQGKQDNCSNKSAHDLFQYQYVFGCIGRIGQEYVVISGQNGDVARS